METKISDEKKPFNHENKKVSTTGIWEDNNLVKKFNKIISDVKGKGKGKGKRKGKKNITKKMKGSGVLGYLGKKIAAKTLNTSLTIARMGYNLAFENGINMAVNSGSLDKETGKTLKTGFVELTKSGIKEAQKLVNYLSSSQFQTDLKEFQDDPSKLMNKISSIAQGTASAAYQSATTAINDPKSNLNKMASQAKVATKEAVNQAGVATKEAVNQAKVATKGAYATIIDPVNQEKAKEKFSSLWSSAKDYANKAKDTAKNQYAKQINQNQSIAAPAAAAGGKSRKIYKKRRTQKRSMKIQRHRHRKSRKTRTRTRQ